MAREKLPATHAIRTLRERGVPFVERSYRYHEGHVAANAARELDIDLHQVVKTLVMEDGQGRPLVVLMHGDREVSTKALARTIGTKSVSPCSPAAAEKHTGYKVGGISPFGMRKALPVYVEASILELPILFVNAGRRGLLVEISPTSLVELLHPVPVSVAR
ncbi:MAG: Cys-tRNA(Pro) deacylase [Deltaproteobacteria bacterium]|nr:Cys-tRNA(Pro) deacylase [Deltaproteobacteria bacterium]MBW2122681.1 Cys-tRNA(Pro) deacylase [Deltaproteobacteria bacterium]